MRVSAILIEMVCAARIIGDRSPDVGAPAFVPIAVAFSLLFWLINDDWLVPAQLRPYYTPDFRTGVWRGIWLLLAIGGGMLVAVW